MYSVVYKYAKEAHYAMWDAIARQVKIAQIAGDKLHMIGEYKSLWLEENGYANCNIIHGCFACEVCYQNCNECPLNDTLKGCYELWEEGVRRAFCENDYDEAYNWAIKIRDGWK